MARLMSQLILSLVDKVTGPARQATASLRGITRAVVEGNRQSIAAMAERNSLAVKKMRGELFDAVGTFGAVALAIRRPLKDAREFETVLTDIGQKADLSRKQQLALGAAIRALGPRVNQGATQLAGGVDILAGFGLDPQRSLAMMRPIGKAATAYRAEIEDLARASFAVTDNLKLPFQQTGRAIDIMAQAGKEGAFELKDMAQYFPSLTAGAQALGQTGAPAVADLAAALQITRKGAGDAAEAATNLENVLQKMRSPQTRRAFAKMGVDLEKSLAAAQKTGMTPIEAIAVVTERTLKGNLAKIGDLFQDMQVQKGLRPLIQNLKEYRRIREAAGKASGVVDRDYVERLRNGAAASSAFSAKIQNLAISFGTALLPGVNAFLGMVGPIADGLASMSERFPGLTRLIVGSTVAVVSFRLAMVAWRFGKAQMLAGLLDLGKGLVGFRNLAMGAALAARGNLVAGLMASRLNAELFVQGLEGIGTVGGRWKAIGASMLSLLNPMRLVRGALSMLKFSLRGVLIGSGIGLLVLAAGWIIANWSKVKAFFAGFGQGFMAAIAPVKPALQPLINGVRAVVGWVGKLLGDSGGKESTWRSWGLMAGQTIGGVVTWVAKLIGGISTVITKAGEMWAALRRPAAGGGPAQPFLGAPALRARARGGGVRQGEEVVVGERGPEIFRAGRTGTVYPNRELGRAGSQGGGRSLVFAPRINVHAPSANAHEVADLVMSRMRDTYRQFSAGTFADPGVAF
jgi:TP901 family phage tail tape measure protein